MYADLYNLIVELLKQKEVNRAPRILVVGCSTSEVVGEKIGTSSSLEAAKGIYETLMKIREHDKELYIAIQCCEHLNRALLIDEELRKILDIKAVNVIPHIHAGGAMATYAYEHMDRPCMIESLEGRAQYGVDIGDTFIGMHMQEVVIPFRSDIHFIGSARVKCAYSREKYIGGPRAKYEV